MIPDLYKDTAKSLSAPAAHCFSISPNDNEELEQATKALYIGIAGSVALRPVMSETDVAFMGVPAGTILPVRISAVRATGTTAGAIVGLA